MRDHFKPEFLNRLDEIVVFDTLEFDQLKAIVDVQLDELAARLANRRLGLDVPAEVKSWLAERGFDPVYGARPLRRLVQHTIGDRLARALLPGTFTMGTPWPSRWPTRATPWRFRERNGAHRPPWPWPGRLTVPCTRRVGGEVRAARSTHI